MHLYQILRLLKKLANLNILEVFKTNSFANRTWLKKYDPKDEKTKEELNWVQM